VSAYDSTGNLGDEYASATLSGSSTVEYNGTSGNWRFDNLTFSGIQAVPEPSSVAMAGCGFAALVGLLRLKKRQA
jgi:hypothetical protein